MLYVHDIRKVEFICEGTQLSSHNNMVLELIRFSFEECEINLQVLVDAKAFVLSLKFNPK